MPHHLIHPRDEIMKTMERIYHYRMTTTSGGNISIREDDGSMWITPSRIDKGSLRREDIVCVKPDGTVVGPHKPSSEYPFHQAVYAARPDLRAIVHAHPVALVAFSICGRVPNTRLFYPAWHVCGEVALAPYALPGSSTLGTNIARTFAKGFSCVVLENHGVVTAGENLQSAFERFETLEFTAKTIIKAEMLGEVRYLTDAEMQLPSQLPKSNAEFKPGRASSAEKELRRQLCDFVGRAYKQRLMISTEGSFSARLDDDTFLVTPYHVDRNALTVDDIVTVRSGAAEAGKNPSRATQVHRAIYQRHPAIKAIVNAYTVNASAFSVCKETLDSRTIPESYIFLREVGRVPYGTQFRAPASLADTLSPERPATLMENDGVLICGTSILDAFDRLEVLETTAEALINARHLGEVTPMSTAVIEELTAVFLKP